MTARLSPPRTLLAGLALGFDIGRALVRSSTERLVRGGAHPTWSLPYQLAMTALRVAFHDHHALTRSLGRRRVRGLPRQLPGQVRLHAATLAGRDAEVHVPARFAAGGATILYLHGGGYVTCSPASHRGTVASIARVTNARCVVLDYRLAPEHPFPAALDDAEAAYRALAREPGSGPLLIAGDSAGGGLCAALLVRLRDAGQPLPCAAVLLSPWVDLADDHDVLARHGQHDYLAAHRLADNAAAYAGGTPRTHPLISPLRADLTRLPPLLVQTGEWELLHGQIMAFVARAREAGVEVTCLPEPGMLHAYSCFAGVSPQAVRALAAVGRYVRARVAAQRRGSTDSRRARSGT